MSYNKYNIFAKIIRKEIPANIIYEDDKIIAFKDINPSAPVHLLILPKGEYIDNADFATNASAEEIKYFYMQISKIAKELGVFEEGYRLITNKGINGGQSVPHFHVHLLGGSKQEGF